MGPIPRATLSIVFLGGLASLVITGCSSRSETPTVRADSTLAYASKIPGDVEATITFCRKVGSKTGTRFGEGQVFTLGEDSKVQACVDLENAFAPGERNLMFHLVWLGPGDERFYKKQIDYARSDSSATLSSSISIPPDRRDPGDYALRVYLFRELIAEKRFELRAPTEESS